MKLTFILYSAQTISKEKAFLALVKYNSSLYMLPHCFQIKIIVICNNPNNNNEEQKLRHMS